VRVLVVNPGSSTLKAALVVDGETLETDEVTVDAGEVDLDEVREVSERWAPVEAVGVRFVHGGPDLSDPVVVDPGVLATLEETVALAPLHNPPALTATRALDEALPDVPVVACFDTAFHRTLPDDAAIYAVPRAWNERWRLRRYGFHGLSHAYACRQAARTLGRPLEELRVVTAHLGGGASLCAVKGGVSVDTTMGFTPLAGLVMQVRSGSVDPGLVLWLQQEGGLSLDELTHGLEHEAGLRGLSGTSGDMREVLAGIEAGDEHCRLAFDVYAHRLVREIGAMVASAGGLDALVFTGGVGEHTPRLRTAVVDRLAYLGVELDESANESERGPDREVSTPGSGVRVLVVEAREDLEIARAVEGLLGARM